MFAQYRKTITNISKAIDERMNLTMANQQNTFCYVIHIALFGSVRFNELNEVLQIIVDTG